MYFPVMSRIVRSDGTAIAIVVVAEEEGRSGTRKESHENGHPNI